MEAADYLEAATSYFGLTMDTLSFYMTVTSGYLVVAYLAGEKLSRSQIAVISTLYIFMASTATYGLYAFVARGSAFALKHSAIDPGMVVYATPVLSIVLSATLAGGIIASLLFMWNIRRTKLEWPLMAHLRAGTQWHMPLAEMKTTFVRPASAGKIIGRGETLKLGKKLAFIEASLLNENGELLAKASGTACPVPFPEPAAYKGEK
jgi:uncharacterized protein (TIGR00369 family)